MHFITNRSCVVRAEKKEEIFFLSLLLPVLFALRWFALHGFGCAGGGFIPSPHSLPFIIFFLSSFHSFHSFPLFVIRLFPPAFDCTADD